MELQDLAQFGSNVIVRKTEIKQKTQNVPETYPIELGGHTKKLQVISVQLGFPVYRLKNGRTSTYQLEYLALHPELPDDFFARDNDAITAQKAQHEVLKELVEEQGLLKSFKKAEHQVQPLICTNTGIVVNGNRRLCAWRTLYLSDPERYQHFKTIEVAVLPECNEPEIEELEEKLQIHQDKRADYKWHATAMMAQRKILRGDRDVAKSFNMSSQKLNKLIAAKEKAEKYLQAIGKPNQWSLVDKEYYAFEKLVKRIKDFSDNQGDQELFETLVFSIISQGSDSGRLYDVIDDVADHFEALKADLAAKYHVEAAAGGGDEIDIIAGEHIEEDLGSRVASVVRNADEDTAARIIKQVTIVIENENAIRSEMEAATYLIQQVSKSSSLMKAAADQGLSENTETEGVQEHLNAIKQSIEQIEVWLRNRNR